MCWFCDWLGVGFLDFGHEHCKLLYCCHVDLKKNSVFVELLWCSCVWVLDMQSGSVCCDLAADAVQFGGFPGAASSIMPSFIIYCGLNAMIRWGMVLVLLSVVMPQGISPDSYSCSQWCSPQLC